MNLYLFNDNDSAATFGIGTYLKELAHTLIDTDIKIHIVHLRSTHPVFEIKEVNNVENWYVPEVRNDNTFSGTIQKVESYYRNVIYLLRLNIKDTADLFFHFNYNQYFALAKGLKEVFECKTVTTVHFLKWALELNGNLSKLHTIKSKPENQMTPFEHLIYTTDEYDSLLYKETDKVIALSRYMKNLLCSEYKIDLNKISIIPNGLQDMNIGLVVDRDALRHKWHISKNEFLILYVGRLHAAKGLTFLIDAFHKVLEKIPESRLMIAGSGNFESYMQASKNICTKVTFTGLMNKNELHELYQIADVGVMPSMFETFGYVAVEMMMHELPIVATTTSGLNEVIDETSGVKVPIIEYPDGVEIDTELLAEKIMYILTHPEDAKLLGNNARKRYLKQYSREVYQKNMLNFYNQLRTTNNN